MEATMKTWAKMITRTSLSVTHQRWVEPVIGQEIAVVTVPIMLTSDLEIFIYNNHDGTLIERMYAFDSFDAESNLVVGEKIGLMKVMAMSYLAVEVDDISLPDTYDEIPDQDAQAVGEAVFKRNLSWQEAFDELQESYNKL